MTAAIHQAYMDCLSRLTDQRLDQAAQKMGIPLEATGLRLPFFDHTFGVTSNGIADAQGNPPSDAVGLALCRYVLNYPDGPYVDGPKMTFRELAAAGPLVSSFAGNTNKLIAGHYGIDVEALKSRSFQLLGREDPEQSGYDVAVCFAALPKVPLYLQFNAADDMLPAQSSLLFRQSAERYMDMQTLFILGTYLAGRLVAPA